MLLEALIAQRAPVLQIDDRGNTSIHQSIEQSNGRKPTILDSIARALIRAVRPRAVNIAITQDKHCCIVLVHGIISGLQNIY